MGHSFQASVLYSQYYFGFTCIFILVFVPSYITMLPSGTIFLVILCVLPLTSDLHGF